MSLTKKLTETPIDEIQKIISNSYGIKNVLRDLGVCLGGNNYSIMKKFILENNIDTSIMHQNRFKQRQNTVRPKWVDDTIFSNPNVSRNVIKNYILRHNKIAYKCDHCNNIGIHNNKPLSLHLDHINGINNDNRIENLRFLCPNCHSQTDSYAGKNQKKLHKEKVVKPKELGKIREPKFKWPSNEDLQKMLDEYPPFKLSKILKVSDRSISKRARKMNLVLKPCGYWLRK